jgi:NAD(P)-dependent dehydrogenase (short-subunit alcohol dehydrogenase family)
MGYTLITGATSDIGIQICKTLEVSGHSILMTDLSQEALEDLKNNLVHPERHKVLALDLSKVEQSKDVLSSFILDNQISVSKAVFAAGIFAIKPLRIIDYEFLKKSYDIAVFSIFAIMQVLASKRINNDTLESIVVISSVNSKMGVKGYSIYGSLKASMLGLVKSLAVELAPRVRVNAVLPGGIRTRTTQFLFDAVEEINPRYLLGEGKSENISDMIDFLLSDKAGWITGQEFVVDGGLTIN